MNFAEEIQENDFISYSIPWRVGTLLDYLDNIHLEDENEWSIKRKSWFIESLILGIPTGNFVFVVNEENPSSFNILDGNQRISAIRDFFGGSKSSSGCGFTLESLPILKSLNGYNVRRIRLEVPECLSEILDAKINVTVLRGVNDFKLLRTIETRVHDLWLAVF